MSDSISRGHWCNIGFIAGLCERHFINFVLYSDSINQPEPARQYRKILNKVWEYLAGQLHSLKNLEKALEQLEAITPVPREADNYGVYPAADACLLLTSALQMILDDSIDDTEMASNLSLATVAQFIGLLTDAEFDPLSQTHELYEQELQTQEWLRESLSEQQSRSAIIKQLRRDLGNMESSNLGISID